MEAKPVELTFERIIINDTELENFFASVKREIMEAVGIPPSVLNKETRNAIFQRVVALAKEDPEIGAIVARAAGVNPTPNEGGVCGDDAGTPADNNLPAVGHGDDASLRGNTISDITVDDCGGFCAPC